MEFKLPDYKTYKWHIAVFFIYLIIALAMFWNISGNIGGVVPNGGGDVYQSMWGLWWVPYAIFTLHQSPYITKFLFYPLGSNLVSQTMSPLAGIITAPIQAIAGVAATYNLLFFLSFALGGLFTFMLVRYLVKNDYAAFIAGLIFAFSPMHIAQAYSHLQWTTIEFIPLFILYFLLMIRTKEKKYALYAAISFIFLTFAGDIEQGIMMVAFAVIALIVLAIIERKEVLSSNAAINLGLLGVFILVIGSPFLISIISNNVSGALTGANQLSDVAHNMLYSDTLASFFLPSYYNGIFHGLSLSYVNSVYALTLNGVQYSPDITEKVSYIGYSVIFLVILAFYHEHKKNKMRDIIFWIAIMLIFILLAIGPFIQIFGTSTGVPSLYAVYRDIPLFNLVREPGRFDVVVTLALAVLAAIGFDHLSKSKYGKDMLMLTVVFSILILIEYNGIPLGSFANTVVTNAQISHAYYEVGKLSGNFSVLMLPALPNLVTGSFFYPGLSMYYQTAFQKPLFGGYTTRVNASQEQLLENVPLVDSAGYLQTGDGFLFPYPITENYSQLSLFWLAVNKVGIIGIMNSAYNQSELQTMDSYLYSIFGYPVYQDANVTVYSPSQIETAEAGTQFVSYIVGNWTPGYEFCSSSITCNQTTATTWWGQDPRGITVFSPNATKTVMTFQAESAYSGGVLYLYNGNNQPVGIFNLSTSLKSYSVNVTVGAGLSQIVFYQLNSTLETNPYLNFGLRNITFVPTR